MEDKKVEAIKLHVAGATVVHKGVFNSLESPKNEKALEKEFIQKFLFPIYNNLSPIRIYIELLKKELEIIFDDIDAWVVNSLLGDFNWRTRSVGAFFSTIKNLKEFEDTIGVLLLKSEVTYAGKLYCLTLAEFNDQKSLNYLNQYLDYYLTQKDLWFEQNHAMAALAYLDKQNASEELEKHLSNWTNFVSNKNSWDLNESIVSFEKEMKALRVCFELEKSGNRPKLEVTKPISLW
ncbi:hypothetical protein I2I11_08025, partial [Pontibacter sp. 172403-2]|uniref:DUF6000 family protein n=1 Tax=Pontibacter rufus TaxID=2791028 RepID=UPI001A175642